MLDPESSLADGVLRLVGTRWRVDQFTYLDEDLGFVYLSAPAAANIRTIGSLQKGVAQLRDETFNIINHRRVLNRDESLIANPKVLGFEVFDAMLNDETVIKFAFVRDPVERFAAVYRSHFSMNAKNGPQRKKLFEFLGMPLTENLSMLDLAELLNEEKELIELTPQLVLQRNLIAFDLIDYHFIGKHEQWDDDYARISMEVFGCETPRFDPVKDLNVDPEGQNLVLLVDDETRAELEEIYAEDYDMLTEIEEHFPDGFAVE